MRYVFTIIINLFLLSCNGKISDSRKAELWIMIKSDNPDSIINATLEINKSRDTSMVGALLYNPYDPRITHRLGLKGKSVYQIKMEVLGALTGYAPPKIVTNEPDSVIVNFYLNRLSQ